jgi:DNA/RNA-binding domain of Phe-tRNA-synthetase-like protein
MNYKLKLASNIVEKCPDYHAVVIYAKGLENSESDESSTALLRSAEAKQRELFGVEKASSHPHITAWRDEFKNFGAKPSKFPCSVEALLSRTLKEQDIPTINRLVDLYNAVSIKHVLPVGGEDWDHLTSDLVLTFATGEEPFITNQNGEPVTDYPSPNEVIWADSSGVTCRRWNWRQCQRTQLTVDTRNAYFVLDRLPPYSLDSLMVAGQELMDTLQQFSPNCTVSYEILSADNLG